MTLWKYICGLILCAVTLCVFGEWHEPGAKYRLEVTTDMPEEYGYIDFSRICLPVSLENGAVVYNQAGEKIPSSLNIKLRGVTFAPDASSRKKYLYWGFDKEQQLDFSAENIGAVAVRSPLELTVVSCRTTNVSLEEWIKIKRSSLERWNDRSIKTNKERIPVAKMAFDKAEKEFGPQRDDAYAKAKKARGRVNAINKNIKREKSKLSSASKQLRNAKRKDSATALKTKYQKMILVSQKKIRGYYRRLNKEYKQIRNFDKKSRQFKHKVNRTKWRYDWSKKNLITSQTRKEKAIKDLLIKANEENGRELEFLKYFPTSRKLRTIGTCLPEKIYLTNMPFGYRSGFAARFAGSLVIEKAGEYEFAVDSTSNILLFIDDELVINWFGDRKPNNDWSKNCKVKLTRGLHDFKLYYKRALRSQTAFVLAAWKKPGDKEFSVLTEDVFAPGYRVKVDAFSDRDGKHYPVIKTGKHISIFSGKKERLFWVNCENMLPKSVEWFIAGEKVAEGRACALFFKDDEAKEVVVKQGDSPEIKVDIPEYETGWKIHTPAKLDLKLWVPQFIYDDEKLDMYMEIFSGLPAEINCVLKVECDKKDNPFSQLGKTYKITGMSDDPKRKFDPQSTLKFAVPLNGKNLDKGLTVTFTLEAGGIVFTEEKLRFVKIDQCPDLQAGYEGLVDADGTRIIPVLHRPNLGDLRRWQLPHIVLNSFVNPKNVLVIADNYGKKEDTLFSALENGFKAENMAVECLPWRQKTAAIDSLADFIKPIREANAEAAIIIPSILDPLSTPRQTRRTLSALIQLLKANSQIKKIKIATPYPSSKTAQPQLIEDIKKLARDHGVGVIDLNRFISGLNLKTEASGTAEVSYFPEDSKKMIADFISKEKW
jgi:PA14 domain